MCNANNELWEKRIHITFGPVEKKKTSSTCQYWKRTPSNRDERNNQKRVHKNEKVP